MSRKAPMICLNIVVLFTAEVVFIDLDAHIGRRRIVLAEEVRNALIEVISICDML